jgi:hypothetical protein
MVGVEAPAIFMISPVSVSRERFGRITTGSPA